MDLPEGFLREISRYQELEILKESLLTEPSVSVRFNPRKVRLPDYPESSKVPWCKEGVYLDVRPQFTFDPSFHQGCYYVQDASSMAITTVLRQLADSPVKYLDACAAPGGKTTAALSVLPEGSVVVANEFDFKRAEILVENIAKWGNPNVLVSRGDTKPFRKLHSLFDIVAVDAPCSGEGMMRKDSHAIEQWSDGLVRQCASLQREILGNVWESLRVGGYLIYSTCTFNRSENEENVKWLIDEYDATSVKIDSLEINPAVSGGIECQFPCYRFIPGRIKGEGLFLAVLRKTEMTSPIPKEKKQPLIKTISETQMESWFTEKVELLSIGDEIFALPMRNASFLKSMIGTLDVLMPGVKAAKKKGKDFLPAHELSLSSIIEPTSFLTYELNIEEAIRYLRRDSLTFPQSIDKGIVLLKYNNLPLGFVKNIGSRANNLLPKSWSIKNCLNDVSSLIKVI